MRWFIGTLIMINLAILLWGWLGTDEKLSTELAAPGVGTIRLAGEAPAEPVAVPIPAPPRSSGVMDAPAETVPGADAIVAPAVATAAPESQPLTEPSMPATEQPASAASMEPAAEVVAQAEPAAAAESAISDAVIAAPEPRYVPEIDPVVASTQQCSRIGPFENEAAAKTTRRYLASQGQVSGQLETGQVRVGYWVLIPPQASRSAAEAVGEKLKAKGIKDYWIVSKGPVKNGISLGVFSQKENADSFAQRAKAKGFNVEIRDKTKPGQQYWLDYRGSKAITPAEIGTRAPAGVTIQSKGCPATP